MGHNIPTPACHPAPHTPFVHVYTACDSDCAPIRCNLRSLCSPSQGPLAGAMVSGHSSSATGRAVLIVPNHHGLEQPLLSILSNLPKAMQQDLRAQPCFLNTSAQNARRLGSTRRHGAAGEGGNQMPPLTHFQNDCQILLITQAVISMCHFPFRGLNNKNNTSRGVWEPKK